MTTETAYDPAGRAVVVTANVDGGTLLGDQRWGSTPATNIWPLDELAGTTAHHFGLGSDLTIAGSPQLGIAGGDDEAQTAIGFDGVDDRIYGTGPTLNQTGYSFEAWVRADTADLNTGVVGQWNGSGAMIWIDDSGYYTLVHASSGTYLHTTVKPRVGQWDHVVATWDGVTQRFYVNGAEVANQPVSTAPGSTSTFEIGSYGGGQLFHGGIDEVALYSAAMPTGEVVSHYARGHRTDATNLTSKTAYDALGRTTDAWSPTGVRTRAEYDRLARQTATIANYVNGVTSSASGDDDVRSTYAYDALSELTGYCPAVQVYAASCSPTLSAAAATAWHYDTDAAGHAVAEIPPVNVSATALSTTYHEYDAGGRMTRTCTAADGTNPSCAGTGAPHTTYAYDGVGRPTTTTIYSDATTTKLTTTTAYNADGTTASTAFDGTGSAEGTDTLSYTYDPMGRPDQTKRGSTVLTDNTWNPDDTLASRIDGAAGAVGTSSFTYDWAKRVATATLPSGWQTGGGAETFAYRADGLLAARTWNGTAYPLTFAYDAAKRPTAATASLVAGTLALTQTYDRAGNVTADGRTMPSAVTGDAGSVTQTFSYDALNRLTGSSGLAAGTVSYTYDLDGNRLTRSVGPDTYAAVYDRTDELVSISRNGGFALTASYTATGDLTADPETGTSGSTIAYAYDLAHRLTSITPAGGPTTTLALDALGRPLTRTTGSSVDTYSYLGTTDTVVRIANTGGTGAVTDSISDPAGDRLGTKTGSTVAWLTPDLHGSIAAGLAQTAGSVTDAIRYDGYGQTVAVWPSGGSPATSSWKYQGGLDLSPSAIPLYAAGARDYAPGLGMFTSLDTVAGSAQGRSAWAGSCSPRPTRPR